MKLAIYQVDAFTNQLFTGNPACVVPLGNWLPENLLLKIARENAVPETAFFVSKGEKIHLRWFTPEIEMDLCGHATLATAHCLKSVLNYPGNIINFETMSGDLQVTVNGQFYDLDFPSRMPLPAELPENIGKALNIKPLEVFKARDYVLVYASQHEVEQIKIDRLQFDKVNLGRGGVIVTSKGETCDFVSRFFTPQASILEDPVTGSSHCSLTPFWAQRLKKHKLTARQLSERGGELICYDKKTRVVISGQAVMFSEGNFWIP